MREFSELTVILDFEDEWPARVGELIVDLATWYAAHPALANYSAADIASYLESMAFDEGLIHEDCIGRIDQDAAGRTINMVKSSINLDHLRLVLASEAFKRYVVLAA